MPIRIHEQGFKPRAYLVGELLGTQRVQPRIPVRASHAQHANFTEPGESETFRKSLLLREWIPVKLGYFACGNGFGYRRSSTFIHRGCSNGFTRLALLIHPTYLIWFCHDPVISTRWRRPVHSVYPSPCANCTS